MNKDNFIDESVKREDIEFFVPEEYHLAYANIFLTPLANGLTVEEIEYDEYLMELDKFRRKNKEAEE